METQSILFLSPLGHIKITATNEAIKSIDFVEDTAPAETGKAELYSLLSECKSQLLEYFNGTRNNFSVPLDPEGTSFQKKVWQALQLIPYGKTVSYGELAKKLGDKNLMRAVGAANGKNPVAIIIPCHRVIGSNSTLTGYGGGLWRKKFLLDLEQPEKQALLF